VLRSSVVSPSRKIEIGAADPYSRDPDDGAVSQFDLCLISIAPYVAIGIIVIGVLLLLSKGGQEPPDEDP